MWQLVLKNELKNNNIAEWFKHLPKTLFKFLSSLCWQINILQHVLSRIKYYALLSFTPTCANELSFAHAQALIHAHVYYKKQIKDVNAISANVIIEVIEKDEKLLACVRANFCFVPPSPKSKTACGCCVHEKTLNRLI